MMQQGGDSRAKALLIGKQPDCQDGMQFFLHFDRLQSADGFHPTDYYTNCPGGVKGGSASIDNLWKMGILYHGIVRNGDGS